MKQTRIQIAKSEIAAHFESRVSHVFKPTEIAGILSEQKPFWRLAQRTSTQQLIDFLTESSELRKLDFPFPYRSETRYVWGEVPLLEVLLTLKPNAYFSHYTAVRMHGLTEQVPTTLYLNHEQRPQPQSPDLDQGSIAAAFARRPRVSQNTITFGDVRICMLNGMFTDQLGVVREHVHYDSERKAAVRLTNVERTLIDITVRPAYCGGVFEVKKAFLTAKDSVSVNALVAMLHKLKYVYPYHQALGYYLEQAGYKSSLLDLIRQFPMDYDFYLAHEMGETEYIKDWRLYVPKGF